MFLESKMLESSRQRAAIDLWDKIKFYSETQTPEGDVDQEGNHKCPHSGRIPFFRKSKNT